MRDIQILSCPIRSKPPILFGNQTPRFGCVALDAMFSRLAWLGGTWFRHVVVEGRDGSHVRLVVRDVELVGEVPFSQFSQPKGFGKGREGHLEETE